MMKLLLMLAGAIALAGCGGPIRVVGPPGTTPAQWRHVSDMCEYKGVKAAPLQSGGVFELAFARLEVERYCVRAAGYHYEKGKQP